MGEYITGTTNQGGTIGSSMLPIKDFRVDTLTANTINYTTLNPSVNVSIDDVTIIKNSDGELEVNPDLSVTLMNLPNLVYDYTSPTTAGIQFAASGNYNPFINFDTSSMELNMVLSSYSSAPLRTNSSFISLAIDNYFQNYIQINQAVSQSSDNIGIFTDNGDTGISIFSYLAPPTGNGIRFTCYNGTTNVQLLQANYLYVKTLVPLWDSAKNRLYQQNLTAATTTSTTATLLGTALSLTPKFSGYIIINAILRANNNTVGDGVTVSLLNGTTVLDTETYVQEGLASNSHTIFLHYELSGQTIGTALSLSLNFNAVTGGTASAKIVAFDAKEI